MSFQRLTHISSPGLVYQRLGRGATFTGRYMLKAIRSVSSVMGYKNPARPVVAVIGTTGVGKSQLAVSLARSLRGDNHQNAVILSADSMQLYNGLDVITNKVTQEEQQGVEHWGLDVVRPGEGGSWELGKWCMEAGKKVSEAEHAVD